MTGSNSIGDQVSSVRSASAIRMLRRAGRTPAPPVISYTSTIHIVEVGDGTNGEAASLKSGQCRRWLQRFVSPEWVMAAGPSAPLRGPQDTLRYATRKPPHPKVFYQILIHYS
jgi:hypothetical protein